MPGLFKQLIVTSTHGTTATVDVTQEDTPSSLVHRIQKNVENIDSDTIEVSVYTSSGKNVCRSSLDTLQHGSMVHCVLLLVGGKGGFGSNLKAAGKHKMTDNIDACRDLQGRRVRHKTAEAKLRTWQSQAQERELEKVAMEYVKKSVQKPDVEVDVQEVKDMAKKTRQDVKVAVSAGLARAPVSELKKSGKKLALYDDDSSCSDDE
ncbi:hypothetical protein M9434_005403 [Picochlorum sp. BPE23]|nr:hypothetical protein M9434_005403 [Picochlorum sp. BPE23]